MSVLIYIYSRAGVRVRSRYGCGFCECSPVFGQLFRKTKVGLNSLVFPVVSHFPPHVVFEPNNPATKGWLRDSLLCSLDTLLLELPVYSVVVLLIVVLGTEIFSGKVTLALGSSGLEDTSFLEHLVVGELRIRRGGGVEVSLVLILGLEWLEPGVTTPEVTPETAG